MLNFKRLAAITTISLISSLSIAGYVFAAADTMVTVNGVEITRVQFIESLEARYGRDALNDLISELLIRQAAKANNIVISDDRITAEIAKVKSQFQSEDEFQRALANYRLTMESYKEQVWFRLVLETLGQPADPSDEELRRFFDTNPTRYNEQEEVNVKHILVRTEDEAKDILDQLKSGADFAELAKERSQDPGTKDNGGEVGYAARSQLVKEFEDVAFALKPNETSGIVKTQFGYHIIRLIDHKMPKVVTFETAKERVKQDYKDENTKKSDQVLNELRTNAKIDVVPEAYKSFVNTPK